VVVIHLLQGKQLLSAAVMVVVPVIVPHRNLEVLAVAAEKLEVQVLLAHQGKETEVQMATVSTVLAAAAAEQLVPPLKPQDEQVKQVLLLEHLHIMRVEAAAGVEALAALVAVVTVA